MRLGLTTGSRRSEGGNKCSVNAGVLKDSIRKNVKAATPPRNLGAISGLLTGVSFIGGVGGAMALADFPFPRPGSEPEEIKRYFTQSAGAARLSAAGQLISAASLARFTASVAKLAGRSGRGSEGLQASAVAGGSLAAASLATSALCAAALTGRGGRQDRSAVAFAQVGFHRRRTSSWPRLRDADGLTRTGRFTHGRVAPTSSIRRAGLGGSEPAVSALPARRARGMVDPGRTIPRIGDKRHRRRPTVPPLGLTSAKRCRNSTLVPAPRKSREGDNGHDR